MCTVTVVNKYNEPNHIYCGRGTPVGNPFYMGNELVRDLVCDQYHTWFKNKVNAKGFIASNTELAYFLNNLVYQAKQGPINLGCFCAPKRCHCDTIKAYIEYRLNK